MNSNKDISNIHSIAPEEIKMRLEGEAAKGLKIIGVARRLFRNLE